METVYPDVKEIKFRKKKYGVIKNILNDKIQCGICNNDLLNEIISKKMIMVHRSHLFLCCYNCFYKLCEGNEFSCILCKSDKELSNCEKCILNLCKRCINNHKIEQKSNGIIPKCFGCKPQMLWTQRAQAAIVLKIFCSQLEMPNGLLVNETDCEQTVRKYLVKEAKINRNSTMDTIKGHLCINLLLNSYKSTVINKLSDFYITTDDSISIDEYSKQFIQICEHVLEKTCSTLTNFKRIFNLNSHLNPGVSAIMKSLLKAVDDDKNAITKSSVNNSSKNTLITNDFDHSSNYVENTVSENEKNIMFNNNSKNELNNKANYSLSVCKTRSSKAENENNLDDNSLNVTKSSSSNATVQPNTKEITKELTVVLERFDSAPGLFKIADKKPPINVQSDLEMSEIDHPLDLLDDIISDDEESSRKLRNSKITPSNKEVTKRQAKKLKNNLNSLSDDEKENNRLINLNNIKISSKKIKTDEENYDTDGSINNLIVDIDEDGNSLKISKNKEDEIQMIAETIQNIDENHSDSDTVNGSQNIEYCLESLKDIFTDVKNTMCVPQIVSEPSNGESDDSSISDVINTYLSTCNKKGIDYYRKKNQSDVNNMDEELEDEEISELSSNSDNPCVMTRSRKLSPLKLPSISDDSVSDFEFERKRHIQGKKRKILSCSSNDSDSDSSSKFFKKTPKKLNLRKSSKSSDSHSSSSSSTVSSPIVKKQRRNFKRVKRSLSSESNSDDSNKSNVQSISKKGRKNIRKLKKKTELSQLTLCALKEEDSRKKRIEERQKLYNQIYDLPKSMEICKKLILDFDPKTKEELITVHPDIVKFLKPHQVDGIKFLWNSVFESLAQTKKSKGSGSIVAHCMGLGKTLQIVALVHTLFKYPETGIKMVLIITPHTTIENWCNEFHKWLDGISEEKKISIFNLIDSKTYKDRNNLIKEWIRDHGVLITSYQLYRSVVNSKYINKFPSILEGLTDPGPDLVVCDEGHLLKNQNTATSKTVNRIKTLRRIVLTGTPLQNNLKEYHCMVDFIRPNLLGSIKDFTNRFVNPISNGQYSDSTPQDVRLMKRRSHVLHRMLEGFVQRFDYSVLTPFLPPKQEYVIYLKMADKQIELYRYYLDNCRQPELFTNYNILQMIWTHPKLLKCYAERTEDKRQKQKFKDMEAALINDSTSYDSSSNSIVETENEQLPVSIVEQPTTKGPEFDLNWWKSVVQKKDLETVYPYAKFIMMFSILQECEEIGDKVILFSQSLYTLDLIQEFLENAEDWVDDKGTPYSRSWTQGEDFFRIDGSVGAKTRDICCEQFNDVTNTRMRLLLLSTKAFNLGINLVGANRVIIFDVTWNPSLNVQSIFRVFRFGQKKPCYIYRLVSEGTMEQKIYERQISKLSLSFRVVDEHQIDRHFNAKDQEELYEFEPNTSEPKSLNLPKDRLMAELILKHKDLVIDILEHDSLLQNNEAEELDENDRNAAWEDYQKEKDGMNIISTNNKNTENLNHLIHQNPNSMQFQDIEIFNTLKRHARFTWTRGHARSSVTELFTWLRSRASNTLFLRTRFFCAVPAVLLLYSMCANFYLSITCYLLLTIENGRGGCCMLVDRISENKTKNKKKILGSSNIKNENFVKSFCNFLPETERP